MALAPRARSTTSRERTPAALGFAMPAEWEPHAATWLAWPHNPTDWPDKLDTIRWVYAEMVRQIAPGESVRMLVNSRSAEKQARRTLARAGADTGGVEFIVHPTNRGWMRDSGPLFVRRRAARGLETAIVHFHFNAWAKYRDWRKDRRVPETAAALLGKKLFDARAEGREFVLEGGGIEVNGRGTLVTTEECYLSERVQVRNPGLTKSEFEAAVREFLGVTNVFWLGGGVAGDDTHGHVDDICRFVDPRTVVLIREDESKGRELPAAGGELGAHPGSASRGRFQARGGGAAHARAAVVRRRPAARQLRQLLHLATRRCWCRRSTIPTTASRSGSWANCSRPARWWASMPSTWCWASARCIA